MTKVTDWLSVGCGAVAIVISVVSCQRSETAAKSMGRYQVISTNLAQFGEASTTFGAVLRAPNLMQVFGGEPAKIINGSSDAQLEAMVTRAETVLAKYDAYTSAVNKSRAGWSRKTDDLVIEAGAAARRAVSCYLIMRDLKAEGTPGAAVLRPDLLTYCSNEDQKRVDFENAYNASVKSMQEEVQKLID